ncbi:glycosyltransferase family 25 protein [Acetobacter sp.]|uniref:glycosyltransferase family 25 protein n=1 Tax=Acetobacter sp. TaxID=440 RepID=UPI0039EA59EB
MRYHVLNLARDPERLAIFRQNNPECTYFSQRIAVDGRQVDRAWLINQGVMQPDLLYTDGAVGCALSHMSLWTDVVQRQEAATIAEDDAILREDFREIQEKLLADLPDDWELVHWGFNTDAYVTFQLIPGVTPFTGTMYHDLVLSHLPEFRRARVAPRLETLLRCHGTMCYSISPRGAKRLLEQVVPLRPMSVVYPGLSHQKINTGIDDMMADYYGQMNAYVCFPPVVVSLHDVENSTVQTKDMPCDPQVVPLFPEEKTLDEDALVTHSLWRCMNGDGQVMVPRIGLLPDGRLGGLPEKLSGCSWHRQGRDLFFKDAQGVPWLRFYLQSGGYKSEGGGEILVPIMDFPLPSPVFPSVCGKMPQRRNLVIVRAGPSSLHPQWLEGLVPEERTWDLCVSYYGTESEFSRLDGCEYAILQNKERKWPAIAALLGEDSAFWHYDYVMMPDDDLAMTGADINRCFAIMAEYKLELAQPALPANTPRSQYSHDLTLQRMGNVLRYTSFVEVMTPLFSREALRECLPSFGLSRSGWGLDWVWPSILGYPRDRIAIIDSAVAYHTRPVGSDYAGLTPTQDEQKLVALFGTGKELRDYGAVPLG